MSFIDNLFSTVKGWWNRMLGKDEIKKILTIEPAISEPMRSAIERWSAIYEDRAEWTLDGKVKSLHLGNTIPREVARSVTIELKADFKGTRGKWLEEQFKPVINSLRADVEYCLGKGGFLWKPYVYNGKLFIDRVQADAIHPIRFSPDGEMSAVLFQYQQKVGDKYWTRLEYHDNSNGVYTIRNLFYRSDSQNSLGNAVSQALVPVAEWQVLEPQATIHGANWLLMSYMRAPGANPVDPSSPLGVSIFARAENLIRNADEQYGLTMWEYQSGKRKVFVDELALTKDAVTGELKANMDKELYVFIPGRSNVGAGKLFDEHNPAMRDDTFWNGLDNVKRQIEFACGLAYGTISNPNSEARTATEIAMQKQRSYSTIKDVQNALEYAMRRLLDVMSWYASAYGLAPEGDYRVEFNFDDSIVTDIETERKIWLDELSQGLRSKSEYRQHFFGESEKEAAKALDSIEAAKPKLGALMDAPQQDVFNA